MAALKASPWHFFHGTVLGFLAREDDFLVLVRHPRIEGDVGVAFLWPDADLTGDSTGEPQPTLDDWVVEIAMDLDEYFATAPPSRLLGRPDAKSGHRIVWRYEPGA